MAPRQKIIEIPDIRSPSPELNADISSDEEENPPSFEYCLIEDPVTTFVREHVSTGEVKFLIRYENIDTDETVFSDIPVGCTVQQLVDRLNLCLSPWARLNVFVTTEPQDGINYVVEVRNSEHIITPDNIESPRNSDVRETSELPASSESPAPTNNNDVTEYAEEMPTSSGNPFNEVSEPWTQERILSVLTRALIEVGNSSKYSPTANSIPHNTQNWTPVTVVDPTILPSSAPFQQSSSIFSQTSLSYSPGQYPSDMWEHTASVYMPSSSEYAPSLALTSSNYSSSLPSTSSDYSSASSEYSPTFSEYWANHNTAFAAGLVWSPTNSLLPSTIQSRNEWNWQPWSTEDSHRTQVYSVPSTVNSSSPLYIYATPPYTPPTPMYPGSSPDYMNSPPRYFSHTSPVYTPRLPPCFPPPRRYSANYDLLYSPTTPEFSLNFGPRYLPTLPDYSPIYRSKSPIYTSGPLTDSPASPDNPRDRGEELTPDYMPDSPTYSPHSLRSLTPESLDNSFDRGTAIEAKQEVEFSSSEDDLDDTLTTDSPYSLENSNDKEEAKKECNRVERKAAITIKFDYQTEDNQQNQMHHPEVKMEIKLEFDQLVKNVSLDVNSPPGFSSREEIKHELNKVVLKTEIKRKYDRVTEDDTSAEDTSLLLNNSFEEKRRRGESELYLK